MNIGRYLSLRAATRSQNIRHVVWYQLKGIGSAVVVRRKRDVFLTKNLWLYSNFFFNINFIDQDRMLRTLGTHVMKKAHLLYTARTWYYWRWWKAQKIVPSTEFKGYLEMARNYSSWRKELKHVCSLIHRLVISMRIMFCVTLKGKREGLNRYGSYKKFNFYIQKALRGRVRRS